MAKFKISDVFEITNRGYVLSGEIVDGEIDARNLIHFDKGIIIKSVESINIKNQEFEVGLLIGYVAGMTKDQLKELLGRTISIT